MKPREVDGPHRVRVLAESDVISVAEVVQCGLDERKALRINSLTDRPGRPICKLLILLALGSWLLRLDSNQQPSG